MRTVYSLANLPQNSDMSRKKFPVIPVIIGASVGFLILIGIILAISIPNYMLARNKARITSPSSTASEEMSPESKYRLLSESDLNGKSAWEKLLTELSVKSVIKKGGMKDEENFSYKIS